MSSLIIKQKFFSLGGEFWVTDENENPKYRVKGSFMKIPKSFNIFDQDGTQRASVTHKVLSFLPKFFLEIDGQEIATISKKLTFLKPRYEVEAGNVTINGNIWDMNFEIERNGLAIGRINKKWLSVRDTYRVEILNDADELLVLGLVLAIDYVKSQEAAAASSES